MKKVIVLCLILIMLLSGCTDKSDKLDRYVESNVKHLVNNSYKLVILEEGGVIYVSGLYVLVPYYSPNGKLCHYVDGEIVEID